MQKKTEKLMAGSMRTFVTDWLTDWLTDWRTDMTDFRGHSVCPKTMDIIMHHPPHKTRDSAIQEALAPVFKDSKLDTYKSW